MPAQITSLTLRRYAPRRSASRRSAPPRSAPRRSAPRRSASRRSAPRRSALILTAASTQSFSDSVSRLKSTELLNLFLISNNISLSPLVGLGVQHDVYEVRAILALHALITSGQVLATLASNFPSVSSAAGTLFLGEVPDGFVVPRGRDANL